MIIQSYFLFFFPWICWGPPSAPDGPSMEHSPHVEDHCLSRFHGCVGRSKWPPCHHYFLSYSLPRSRRWSWPQAEYLATWHYQVSTHNEHPVVSMQQTYKRTQTLLHRMPLWTAVKPFVSSGNDSAINEWSRGPVISAAKPDVVQCLHKKWEMVKV